MCSSEKLVILDVRFVRHISLSGVSIGLDRFFQKTSQLHKIVLKQVEDLIMMNKTKLNAGMSATVASLHFGCTQKTIEHLQRRFCVTGNVADSPQRGKPRVTTGADDCYIILQHLHKRRLTAAATLKTWYSSTDCQKSVEANIQPIRASQPYFSQILTPCH